jgi:hypothetical protein
MIFMRVLIITLSRVYFLLLKVKNQSPFLGAIIIVTILLNSLLFEIITCYFLLKKHYLIINEIFYFLTLTLVFLLVYYFANKNKKQIIATNQYSSKKNNLLVAGLFIFTLVSFIWSSNINRARIKNTSSETEKKIHKESLEREIRDLFD